MILIGIGGNLPSPSGGPAATCTAALDALNAKGVQVLARSPWYETAPVPVSDQPWFVNGVAQVAAKLAPEALLALLHAVERDFGRVRGEIGAARPLDLDLLAYNDLIQACDAPLLPHPRLQERAFVLLPLCDIAPEWRHPALGLTARQLADKLPPGQGIRSLTGKS
jgi:2-amino-4-hydroxy-6-hydroxymethyldihydropteridine diphosphokinase